MSKTIDIFIKTYHKDFPLLYMSLKTIARNVSGYRNLILLIPEQEKELFDTRDLPPRTLVHYVKEYGTGWLYQQVCKMKAHEYSDADYILFTDSDCFWYKPFSVQDLIADDIPEILYTPWLKVGDAIAWREPTEKFLGETVDFEFMRRFPLVYHRDTLVKISEFAPDIESTIMQSIRFSEFNCIGAYAFKNERDRYKFINTDDWVYVPPVVEQVWSHSSKAEGVSETHLREYIRVLETILKSNGIEPPK